MPGLIIPGFGDRLRLVFAEKGLSQADFAREHKIPPNQVSRWLAGKQMPTHGNMMALADALDVAWQWLLVGDDGHEAIKAFIEKRDGGGSVARLCQKPPTPSPALASQRKQARGRRRPA